MNHWGSNETKHALYGQFDIGVGQARKPSAATNLSLAPPSDSVGHFSEQRIVAADASAAKT